MTWIARLSELRISSHEGGVYTGVQVEVRLFSANKVYSWKMRGNMRHYRSKRKRSVQTAGHMFSAFTAPVCRACRTCHFSSLGHLRCGIRNLTTVSCRQLLSSNLFESDLSASGRVIVFGHNRGCEVLLLDMA